jgi:outer membrane protein assembly factor BamB
MIGFARPFLRFAVPALLGASALAGDWPNLGGNAARNGASAEHGPVTAVPLWSNTADPSLIAWQPVIEGTRVFTVRESGFPQNGGAANDAIVAYDLDTGQELWRTTLPFNGNTSQQWIAWIGGAKDGRLYASRASNNQPQPIQALAAATGAPLWTSVAQTDAFAYDGVVFAPDGDPIVGDQTDVYRIDSQTGQTVWHLSRVRSVSGNCGVAATASAVFADEVVGGGQRILKVDLATGLVLYASPTMPGFTEQNAPFLSPDGQAVYFARTQNNVSVDFLYAFEDTGSALVQKWSRPVLWTTSHEHGIGPDGSIYTFLQSGEFVRLDPVTGNVVDTAGVLSPLGNASPKTAVDAGGNVYVSNGWASSPANNGRVWAFNADLSWNYFTLTLSRPNQGGPALGSKGTLVACDLGGVHAWRAPAATIHCQGKLNSQGCLPAISFAGAPSATQASPFAIGATMVLNNKIGLFFYGTSGPASSPFQGGTLCVKSPIRRTPVQASGGNPPPDDCSGVYAFDFNAHIQGGTDPNLVAGAQVDAQYWARDPLDPFTTSLSDAVEFTILP